MMLSIFLKLLFMYIIFYLIPYWLSSLFYYLLDQIRFMKRFKIQDGNNKNNILETAKLVIKNQILTIPFIFVCSPLLIVFKTDMNTETIEYTKLFATLCIFDLLFYIGHYALHNKYFYGRYHKIHHEWKAPIALSAHYNHITEHIIVNMFLPFLSAIITGANIYTISLWMLIATLAVTATHSGYWIFLAKYHDSHHQFFNIHYGVFITDYLFSTHTIKNNDGNKY